MKKILSLVLAVTMALGLSATTFAAGAYKATKQSVSLGYCYKMAQNDTFSAGSNTVDVGTIRPSDEEERDIMLVYGLFSGAGNEENRPTTPGYSDYDKMSSKDIRNSKIVVRNSASAGSKAIESIELNNSDGKIVVKFVDEWVNTGDLDFDFNIYLVLDGKRQNDMGLTFTGTLENYIQDVYDNDDYVDLSYGTVADAQDFINPIEVDLGNGIKIHTKFFKGKKYYGTSTRDADAADDIVFSQYPDVDNVVTLNTVGLNSTGDIVKMDVDYSDYYVYDKDMNYLGQSSQMLPYSTKYYLANKKLDTTGDGDGEEPVEQEPEDPAEEEPGTDGGGDGSGTNPDTGTNGLLNVAVVAAIVSLAAVGAVFMKKKK